MAEFANLGGMAIFESDGIHVSKLTAADRMVPTMSNQPMTIGRFRVLEPLGQGAMGRVYLAEDPSLKRRVAVKVIQAGGFDPAEALRRFQQEAEISARLNHPNIITIHEVGEDPEAGPFLVMEFVDGEGLDALLDRGPLPPDRAMDLLIQAMEALEAAHARGIIHRDIKPANLLIGRDGRVRLTDFGIARGSESTRTSTSGFLGSPAYAAPELLQEFKANAATDHWSFVVTAFKCLTGRLPFHGENLSATLYHVAHGDLSLPGDMNPVLASLFRRALDRDPERRPRDPRRFLQELVDCLEVPSEMAARFHARLGTPIPALLHADAPSPPPRRRWAWAAGAGAALTLLGGAAWWAGRLPAKASLLLESDPSGARVLADGVLLGRTPLRGLRPPPGVTLRLELEDHWPLELRPATEASRLQVKLVPLPYFVDVETDPKGATLRLDGQPHGRAPQRVQVPGEGIHRLEVSSPGYLPSNFPLERRGTLPVPIRLVRDRGEDGTRKK